MYLLHSSWMDNLISIHTDSRHKRKTKLYNKLMPFFSFLFFPFIALIFVSWFYELHGSVMWWYWSSFSSSLYYNTWGVENVAESTFLLHVGIFPHEGIEWVVTRRCLFGIELNWIILHYHALCFDAELTITIQFKD